MTMQMPHPPTPAKSPRYQQFFDTFGGSYRLKHITPRIRSPKDAWKRITDTAQPDQKRRYPIPIRRGLPKEFIRLDPWEGEYLFSLATHAAHAIVETGRFRGGSTFLMAYANDAIPIHSIDNAPLDDGFLRHAFATYSLGGNVELIVGDSQTTTYNHINKCDLLFIDGDHSYEGCTNDLENWFPNVASRGHIVLHDCYFGKEVREAVVRFIDRHRTEVEVVVSPYKGSQHWSYPEGSFAHLMKL